MTAAMPGNFSANAAYNSAAFCLTISQFLYSQMPAATAAVIATTTSPTGLVRRLKAPNNALEATPANLHATPHALVAMVMAFVAAVLAPIATVDFAFSRISFQYSACICIVSILSAILAAVSAFWAAIMDLMPLTACGSPKTNSVSFHVAKATPMPLMIGSRVPQLLEIRFPMYCISLPIDARIGPRLSIAADSIGITLLETLLIAPANAGPKANPARILTSSSADPKRDIAPLRVLVTWAFISSSAPPEFNNA